jgi:hypothetical protein
MCRGVENMPLVVSGLMLPPSTRLRLFRTQRTIAAGALVSFARVAGMSVLMRQFNLVVNSSDYSYQEGCMSARIDGDTELWLSSGLEEYFLGASFHSMPDEHLPYSGFEHIVPATALGPWPTGPNGTLPNHTLPNSTVQTNSLAAYRIHEKDPVLFSEAFSFQWIASSHNADHDGGWCNYDWPQAKMPSANSTGDPGLGRVGTTTSRAA